MPLLWDGGYVGPSTPFGRYHCTHKHIAVGPRAHKRLAHVASEVSLPRFDPVSETALAPFLEDVSRLVSVVVILFFAAATWTSILERLSQARYTILPSPRSRTLHWTLQLPGSELCIEWQQNFTTVLIGKVHSPAYLCRNTEFLLAWTTIIADACIHFLQ